MRHSGILNQLVIGARGLSVDTDISSMDWFVGEIETANHGKLTIELTGLSCKVSLEAMLG